MKKKVLFILHCSPPFHGAAKVGDFIANSKKIKNEFECKFVTIKSSESIEDIGKINLKKIYYVMELYFKILKNLLVFKPDIIYYTSSVRGVAFYRDLLMSMLWKSYSAIKKREIFYHYHTKGIDEFVSKKRINLFLTKIFLKNVNIILLSPLLKKDLRKIDTYKDVFYLPNGVENPMSDEEFNEYISKKEFNRINILFISNMIKSKGYFEVLKLAKVFRNYDFHFAGGWQSEEDKKEFFDFIEKNQLKNVKFHGFVNGEKKKELFKKASFFVFPTRNDAFPLTLLESLSYGIPILSTNEGSIPFIIDEKSGIVIGDEKELEEGVKSMVERYVNKDTAVYCRNRYLENFSLEQFEKNLIRILNGDNGV